MHEGPHTYLHSTGSSETMQLLCVAALLLSAVAAQSDFWQDETSPPADGSHVDADCEFVTQAPVDGDGENGNSPMEGTDVSTRGKRQAPGFRSDGPGVPRPRPGRQSERRRGHSGDKKPNMGDMDFSPAFKVDNVAFQNTTEVTLNEGENVFLMRRGGRGPHHQKGGRRGPPKIQYVKLIYERAEPNKVSIEVGVLKRKSASMKMELFGVEYPEEDY